MKFSALFFAAASVAAGVAEASHLRKDARRVSKKGHSMESPVQPALQRSLGFMPKEKLGQESDLTFSHDQSSESAAKNNHGRKMQVDDDGFWPEDTQDLVVGVPYSFDMMQSGEEIFFRYEKEEGSAPTKLTCYTSASDGDVDLQVRNPMATLCNEAGLTANETCSGRDDFAPFLIRVKAFGVAADVTFQCDASPIEDIPIGVEIPIVLTPNNPALYKYEVGFFDSLFCEVSAPFNFSIDVDLKMDIKTERGFEPICESNGGTNNEDCFTVEPNGTIFITVNDGAGRSVEDFHEVTLFCAAGGTPDFIESPAVVELAVGEVKSFLYEVQDTIYGQVVCTMTSVSTDLEIRMAFADNESDRAECTGTTSCHLGVLKDNAILISVISRANTTIDDVLLACNNVALPAPDALEADVTVEISLDAGGARIFSFNNGDMVPADFDCVLEASGFSFDHISISSTTGLSTAEYGTVLSARTYPISELNGTTTWNAYPKANEEFFILVENYHDEEYNVSLTCGLTPIDELVLGEPSDEYSVVGIVEEKFEVTRFWVDISVPSEVTCIHSSDDPFKATMQLRQLYDSQYWIDLQILCEASLIFPDTSVECTANVTNTDTPLMVITGRADAENNATVLTTVCTAVELDIMSVERTDPDMVPFD